MFIHNFDPIFLKIGPFTVYWYGLVYVLGILVITWALQHARKKQLLNITKNQVYDVVMYITLGMLLGARLFHILFWDLKYYLANPLEVFAFWHGGMAIQGGIVGAVLVGWFICKKYKISFLKLADIITIPLMIPLILGRLANFINAEIVGKPSSLPWCVQFPNIEQCRHPYQIYAVLKRTGVLIILLIVNLKPKRKGAIFFLFILLSSLGRLILDFLREDPTFLGLNPGQYFSLLGIFIASIWFYKTRKSKEKHEV